MATRAQVPAGQSGWRCSHGAFTTKRPSLTHGHMRQPASRPSVQVATSRGFGSAPTIRAPGKAPSKSRRAKKEDSMQLKYTHKDLPDGRRQLEIMVPRRHGQLCYEDTMAEFRQKLKVEGHAIGKAPDSAIIEQLGGEDAVQSMVLNQTVSCAIAEAAEKFMPDRHAWQFDPGSELLGVDYTESGDMLVNVSFEPAPKPVWTVPYRDLQVKVQKVKPGPEAVQERLESLAKERAMLGIVIGRGLQRGDSAVMSLAATFEDDEAPTPPDSVWSDLRLETGNEAFDAYFPGLIQAVEGMKTGEQQTCTLTLPTSTDFFPVEWRGRTASLQLHLKELFERRHVELDDAWAASLAPGQPMDLKTLRSYLSQAVEGEAELATHRLELESVKKAVAANMECGCPEYLVRGVAMRLLQCRLRDLHDAGVLSAAQVSALSSQDNATDFAKNNRAEVEEALRSQVGLEHIAESEELLPSEKDVQARYERVAGELGEQSQPLQDPNVREHITEFLITDNVLEWMKERGILTVE
ncbi:TIG1 [Auxenochlorella protothecoides x Auxenochlorella symbiontica]